MANLAANGAVSREQQAAELLALGVEKATWVLWKKLETTDILPSQNRLQLTESLVANGPLLTLFPELTELNDSGKKAENLVPIKILGPAGVEEDAILRYLNSISAYRVRGSGWRKFVAGYGLTAGSPIDLWTVRRNGERCLALFLSSEEGPIVVRDEGGNGDRCHHGTGNGSNESNVHRRHASDGTSKSTRSHLRATNGSGDKLTFNGGDHGRRRMDLQRDANCNAGGRGHNGTRNGNTLSHQRKPSPKSHKKQKHRGDRGDSNGVRRNPVKAGENRGDREASLSWDEATTPEREAVIGLLLLEESC